MTNSGRANVKRGSLAGAASVSAAALLLTFGRWNPIGVQSIVTIIGTPVPSQFMAMLPYLVTALAVAGLVGRSRPPAASGIPYVKG